jgi:hypothetical protein
MVRSGKSNFQLVVLINLIAGNKTTGNWDDLERQFNVVAGEYNELVEAVEERNPHKLRDACIDLLVTTYGMIHRAGFDGDADMEAVITALLTRFDRTRADASKTQEKYEHVGIRTAVLETMVRGHIYYPVVSALAQNSHSGEFFPQGKFLKSHNYQTEIFNWDMSEEVHRALFQPGGYVAESLEKALAPSETGQQALREGPTGTELARDEDLGDCQHEVNAGGDGTSKKLQLGETGEDNGGN